MTKEGINILKTSKNTISKIFMSAFLMFSIIILCLTIVGFGDDLLLQQVGEYFKRHYNLSLNIKNISGNPLKGYVINGLETDKNILNIEYMDVRADPLSLFTGNLKVDKVIINNLKLKFNIFRTDFNINISKAVFNVKDEIMNFSGQFKNIPVDGIIKINTKNNGFNFERAQINFDNSEIFATGGFYNGVIDFHISARDFDLKNISELITTLPENIFKGNSNFDIDITGTDSNPIISGSINCKHFKISGLPVERFEADLKYSYGSLNINNIQAMLLNIPINGAMVYSLDTSYFIKLQNIPANLNDLDKILNIPELSKLRGRISNLSVNISGNLKNNISNGLIKFSAPRISYDGKIFKDILAQIKMLNSHKGIINGKYILNNSQGYLYGTAGLREFDITAKNINLDLNIIPYVKNFRPEGKINLSLNLNGNLKNYKLSGSIDSKNFKCFGQKFGDMILKFNVSDEKLLFDVLSGKINTLPITAAGEINSIYANDPEIKINAVIGDVPADLKISGRISEPVIKFGDAIISDKVVKNSGGKK